MTEPRQHHYIPRFYLGGFADPDILAREKKEIIWVYEKSKEIRRSSPQKEAKQRDYYAFVQNGTRNADIEAWLGRLEAATAPVISALATNLREVTDSEKQILAAFIGTMQMRTPSGRYFSDNRVEPLVSKLMKESASDPIRFRAFIEENDFPHFDDEEIDLEEIRRDILAGRGDELAARPELKLLSIIEVGQMVADVLLDMSWQIFRSGERESFLVSDDPVIAHVFNQETNKLHLRMGVATRGVNVWFPLCRTVCLRILKGEDSGVGRWISAGTRLVNKMMIMCAERLVYASERSPKIKALVEKHGGRVGVKTVDFQFEGQRY